MTDLDIRIGALAQEYERAVASFVSRAATLASELASTQAQLKSAQELVEKQAKEIEELKHPADPAAG